MEKVTACLDSDIISDLPRNITDTIISCLPLRDAVRTCVLSTNWRYCWTNIPKLVFDETMFQLSNRTRFPIRINIISIICRVLLLHQGPLLTVSLSHSFLEGPEFDTFIIFLSKNRVGDLTLNTSMKGTLVKYKLPSSFFSCRELKHLNLSSCVFTPPHAFEGFPRLISLKFVNVNIATNLFGSLVSSCLQLERLTLIKPLRFHCLSISVPNLKYLHLEAVRGQIVIDESEKYLHLTDGEECRLVKFFRCFPALNTLITNFVLLEQLAAGGVPQKLPTSINLKFLKLTEFSFDALSEVMVLCSLISSSRMKKIEVEVVKMQNVDETPFLNFIKALDVNAFILDELREV